MPLPSASVSTHPPLGGKPAVARMHTRRRRLLQHPCTLSAERSPRVCRSFGLAPAAACWTHRNATHPDARGECPLRPDAGQDCGRHPRSGRVWHMRQTHANAHNPNFKNELTKRNLKRRLRGAGFDTQSAGAYGPCMRGVNSCTRQQSSLHEARAACATAIQYKSGSRIRLTWMALSGAMAPFACLQA